MGKVYPRKITFSRRNRRECKYQSGTIINGDRRRTREWAEEVEDRTFNKEHGEDRSRAPSKFRRSANFRPGRPVFLANFALKFQPGSKKNRKSKKKKKKFPVPDFVES